MYLDALGDFTYKEKSEVLVAREGSITEVIIYSRRDKEQGFRNMFL